MSGKEDVEMKERVFKKISTTIIRPEIKEAVHG
jgi:hypothetical protein